MKNKVILTKNAKMWMENGILHCQLFPNTELTLESTKEIVEETLKLCKGKNVPILGDIGKVKYINRESREYFSGEEAMKAASSLALLTHTPVSSVIGNFFLGINSPPYPVKLFTSEDKALKWLEQFTKL